MRVNVPFQSRRNNPFTNHLPTSWDMQVVNRTGVFPKSAFFRVPPVFIKKRLQNTKRRQCSDVRCRKTNMVTRHKISLKPSGFRDIQGGQNRECWGTLLGGSSQDGRKVVNNHDGHRCCPLGIGLFGPLPNGLSGL